ncbi:MAG: hypothetical protein ACYC7L_12370 [Nitrospirota bacterium]
MTDREKPLPKPPKKAFGHQKPAEERGGQELLADQMAVAAAEGRLDEFLKENMPDSEHAQTLARMMMGMTGMMPMPGMTAPTPSAQPSITPEVSATVVPEEVFKAVQGGDVKGLVDLLRKEHQKRSPGEQLAEADKPAPSEEATAQQPTGQPTIDKELIDALVRIASDNSVTLDWIILRAVKVYVEEYRKTGKL